MTNNTELSKEELMKLDAILIARDGLKSQLTKAIEESPCSYEDAIDMLRQQIAWLAKARRHEFPEEKEAYRVEESDSKGCEKCGSGKLWDIVGPDGYALGTSWGDKEFVDDLADWLNDAYVAGKEAPGSEVEP